jgi:integrase
MDRLIAGSSALGWYAPQMKALLIFAAYSGMRPGELFALEWPDIDFDAMRIHVSRRVYKGRVGLPKSNKVRTIALTPPARDAILGHPTRQDGQLGLPRQARRPAVAADPVGLLGPGARPRRARLRLLPRHQALVRPLHARRTRLAAAGHRRTDGLDARWGAAAADRLRPRRRGGTRGDRQGVPGERHRTPGGRLGHNSDAEGPGCPFVEPS